MVTPVHRISTRRKRESPIRKKEELGTTLNTVLADVTASLQRLPGVRATEETRDLIDRAVHGGTCHRRRNEMMEG